MKNAIFTAVFVVISFLEYVEISGSISIVRARRKVEFISRIITFTWNCTKDLWFLKPADNFCPLKVRELRGLISDIGISSSYCVSPLSVYKEILTPIFRATV